MLPVSGSKLGKIGNGLRLSANRSPSLRQVNKGLTRRMAVRLGATGTRDCQCPEDQGFDLLD
jgi:hypothetical protein